MTVSQRDASDLVPIVGKLRKYIESFAGLIDAITQPRKTESIDIADPFDFSVRMIHSTHIDSFLVHHATPLAQCLRKYRVIICLVIPVICKYGYFWMEACDQTVQGRPALAVSFRAFSI